MSFYTRKLRKAIWLCIAVFSGVKLYQLGVAARHQLETNEFTNIVTHIQHPATPRVALFDTTPIIEEKTTAMVKSQVTLKVPLKYKSINRQNKPQKKTKRTKSINNKNNMPIEFFSKLR